LIRLFTLGDVAQIRKGLTVIQGDNSIFMLVEGVIAAIIVGLFSTIYTLNIKDARNSSYCHLTFKQQLYKLYEDKFAFIVLTP
ncbi:sugar ABC transporter permease, partial [Escherichia coli]|nr:sugar ABC transporter permease [Escherichia coli]